MDIISVEKPASGGIIDTHAHYDDERFKDSLPSVFDALSQMGVELVINCAVDVKSSENIVSMAEKFPFLRSAVGFHPENIPDTEPSLDEIEMLSKDKSVVAIGEIGLDYYWDKSRIELQKRWFCEQLSLANRLSLPVIIHDREAHGDTLEILKEYKPQGVLHCFSGSPETAKEIIKLGMYIGVGGVSTFKNAKNCRNIIEQIPMDRILLETDAPYMAPEPYRGKTCHSGMIIRVAEKIAEIKNLSVDEVISITRQNAYTLFNM